MSLRQSLASGCRTVAIDLDDCLAATNKAIIAQHNNDFGTSFTLEDVQSTLWWQNKGWGDKTEVAKKFVAWFEKGLLQSEPVEGSREGIRALRALGFRDCSIVVITARSEPSRTRTVTWLDRYFPGRESTFPGPNVIDEVHLLGTITFDHIKDFKKTGKKIHEGSKLKSETIKMTGAGFLIDDQIKHCLEVAQASPPIPSLLFGEYAWNRFPSDDPPIPSNYSTALSVPWKSTDPGMKLPKSGIVRRVKSWEEVVRIVKEELEHANGKLQAEEDGEDEQATAIE